MPKRYTPSLNVPTLHRNSVIKTPVCPKHPRAGRIANLSNQRLRVSCRLCHRKLAHVVGPFRVLVCE